MIDPSAPSDIGRRAVKIDFIGEHPRYGTITSWNPDWVFIQFDTEGFARPEAREALEWEEDFCARYR